MSPYSIVIDEERRVLRAVLRGFWDLVITENYLTDLRAACVRVARGGVPSWWLIDMSGNDVQSREVTELMGRTLPSIFQSGVTVAVLVGAHLQSMQMKRIVSNEHHRHFFDVDEAECWLTERGMPSQRRQAT